MVEPDIKQMRMRRNIIGNSESVLCIRTGFYENKLTEGLYICEGKYLRE